MHLRETRFIEYAIPNRYVFGLKSMVALVVEFCLLLLFCVGIVFVCLVCVDMSVSKFVVVVAHAWSEFYV